MKLEFNDIYKYADFKEGEKPKLKDEYWKTYYAVIELYDDWIDKHSYGFGNPCNTEYKRGYYVIPIMLWPHNWVRKKGIFVYPRKFETIWRQVIDYEPQDIPEEHWDDCKKFKHYWGIAEHMNDRRITDAEDIEIYDNINEAIARAKNLDKLQMVLFKIGELTGKLNSRKSQLEDIEYKLWRNIYKNELYRNLDISKKEIYSKEIAEFKNKLEMLEKTKQKLGPAYNNNDYQDYINDKEIQNRLLAL